MQTVVKNYAEQLQSLIATGVDAWVKAGELLVEWIDSERISLNDVASRMPSHINVDILAKFESLGRRRIHPALLTAGYPAARALEKVPYSEQGDAIRNGVKLLVAVEGGTDELTVPVENLTAYQTRQAIGRNGVRNIGAQRAWLESEKAKSAPADFKPLELGYEVRGGKILIGGLSLTKRDLKRMLSEIE